MKGRKARLTCEHDEFLSVYRCLPDKFLCDPQRSGAQEMLLVPDPRAIHRSTLNVY